MIINCETKQDLNYKILNSFENAVIANVIVDGEHTKLVVIGCDGVCHELKLKTIGEQKYEVQIEERLSELEKRIADLETQIQSLREDKPKNEWRRFTPLVENTDALEALLKEKNITGHDLILIFKSIAPNKETRFW
jgi:hypothetical protein